MNGRGPAGVRGVVEIERKYDVGALTAVPDVTGVAKVASMAAPQEHVLEAVYFDTADLRLRAAGITLRHRTGGTDAGWNLKLPAGADREELSAAGPAGQVPDGLAALVRARTRGRELEPVAVLTTHRTVRHLLNDEHQALAELADDRVRGRALPAGEELRWREWELELLTGDRDLLEQVQQRLTTVGAAPSGTGSKLARLLPGPVAQPGPQPWWSGRAGGKGRLSAGTLVQAHLAEQVSELVNRDPQVRRDLPDSVHKMRVATRRLRSALATFGPLLDRDRTDPVRAELRWLADALGQARDAEVMHERLRELLRAEPPELVLGPVVARIDSAMTRRRRRARARLGEALDSERYLLLLDALDELAADPPFLPGARRAARPVLARLLRRTWRRIDRSMTRAQQGAQEPGGDELLHQVRKDAKRMRYAAEAVQPVFGRPAARFASELEQLQESLGDFHDGVAAGLVLRELGARGHREGENGFTFGRLHALEQTRAELAIQRWPEARTAVSGRRLRRWFQD